MVLISVSVKRFYSCFVLLKHFKPHYIRTPKGSRFNSGSLGVPSLISVSVERLYPIALYFLQIFDTLKWIPKIYIHLCKTFVSFF